MDGISGGHEPMHMSDEVHLQYMQEHEHHHMSNGNGVADDHVDGSDAGAGGAELSKVDVQSEPVNVSDTRSGMVDHGGNNGDQITLSFQGLRVTLEECAVLNCSCHCPCEPHGALRDLSKASTSSSTKPFHEQERRRQT